MRAFQFRLNGFEKLVDCWLKYRILVDYWNNNVIEMTRKWKFHQIRRVFWRPLVVRLAEQLILHPLKRRPSVVIRILFSLFIINSSSSYVPLVALLFISSFYPAIHSHLSKSIWTTHFCKKKTYFVGQQTAFKTTSKPIIWVIILSDFLF